MFSQFLSKTLILYLCILSVLSGSIIIQTKTTSKHFSIYFLTQSRYLHLTHVHFLQLFQNGEQRKTLTYMVFQFTCRINLEICSTEFPKIWV